MPRDYNKIIPKPDKPKEANIIFSFQMLEANEYFNIDCTCPNWSVDLMGMMQSISAITLKQFRHDSKFQMGTYRIHNHKNAKCPINPPNDLKLEDMYQIRIGKTKGGIHGYLIENVFYVIWLDPLHNMYPSERYGLRKIRPPATCCGWRDDEMARLSKENEIYKELFEKDS